MDTKTRQRKPGTSVGSPRRSRTAKASPISQEVKWRCARRRGRWGRISEDGPGQYNPDPSEDPWGNARDRVKSGAIEPKDRLRGWASWRQRTKGRSKPSQTECMPGGGLSLEQRGKARSEKLVLKPYWGKPAVRNFRGGDGNVVMGAELRPTSKAVEKPSDPNARAIALPDHLCFHSAGLPSRRLFFRRDTGSR